MKYKQRMHYVARPWPTLILLAFVRNNLAVLLYQALRRFFSAAVRRYREH